METIVDSHDTVDRQAWDGRLQSVPAGNFFQSTGYGELCRATLWEEPSYVLVKEHGRVLGQLLVFDAYWLRDRIAPRGRHVVRVWRRLAPGRRWLYGPVIFERSAAEAVTRELLRVAAADGDVIQACPAIHAWPEDGGRGATVAAEWGFSIQRDATLLLDVFRPVEELWARLSPDAKRNVRRARREGITICPVSEADLARYYAVQVENRRRRGLTSTPFALLTQMHGLGCYHAFLSTRDGVAVSAQGAVVWNGIVSLIGCSVSDYSLQHGLHGNDLMQWHVIEWAQSVGARLIDWVGYSLRPTPRQDGINRFKAKWGGGLVAYDTYCRIHPLLRVPLRWYRGRAREALAAQ